MATPIRMKKKLMNKIHLDMSGKQVIAVVPTASDAASKGASAQPANILTPQETTGLPGGQSITQSPTTTETGTGENAERVAPESVEAVQATSAGAIKPSEAAEAAPQSQPAAEPGNKTALPTEAAKDPNAQKETTTVAPNTGSGKIIG